MSASNDIKIKITIDGDSKNVTLVRNEINKLGNSINNVDTYANALRSTLGKFAAVGFAINGLSDAFHKSVASVDALANATGRLKLVTKSNEELKALSAQILNVANSARVSFTETTDLYTRFANNLKNSAVSAKQMVEVTEAVSKSLIISGANAQSANAALIQLSQGLAANSLRGQELASVMEQTPRLAQAIADGMGVTIGQLRKLAEENKLTTEVVFNALYKQKEVIEKEFGQMPVTIGQSMVVLGNNVQTFLGRLNEASGFTKALTTATLGLGSALNAIIPYAGAISDGILTLIGSLAIYKTAIVAAAAKNELFKKSLTGGYVSSFATSLSNAKTASDYLRVGIGATTVALGTLRTVMASVLPVAGIMLAIEALTKLGSLFVGAKERNEEFKKSLELTNEEIKKLTINELNAHMARLTAEQDKLKDSLDKTNDAMHRLSEEIDDEELRDQAFGAVSKGASVLEGKLSAVSEKMQIIKDQIDALSNPNSQKGQFLQANAVIDKILDDNKNIKTKIDLEDAIKTEIETLTKLSELSGITSENERNYLNAKEKTLAKIIKLNDEYENFGKEKSQKGIKSFKDNANALKSALKEIAEVDFSDVESKTQKVFDRYNEMLTLGIGKDKANRFLDAKLSQIADEHIKTVEKNEAEAIAKRLELKSEYYKTIGDMESAWQIEKRKLIEKYENLTLKNGEKITKEQLDKLLKMEEKSFKEGSKIAKNSFKDIKNSWSDTVSSMQKTVEDGFFNFFIGKTKSLKTALKDIDTNLFRDMISPYARTLSQGISGGFGALLGGGSNLASIASNLGLAKNDSGGWSGLVGGTTVELSSTGQILRGADALDKDTTNLLGSISNLKTAYSAFTGLFEGGYSGFISNLTSNPALAAKGWLNGLGYSKLGTAVYDFGAGAQGVLTNSSMPAYFSTGGTVSPSYVAGGAFAGAGIGYAAGTLGDWLTGTQTKAGLGGAIGGGIGGGLASAGLISNPVGWVIAAVGLVIGSFISKAKQTDAGLFLRAAIGAALDEKIDTGDIQKYTEKTKKNWWRKKVSWEYDALDAKTAALLEQSTKAVQMSLRGISATNGLVLSAGHFSANSFLNENLALGALSSFTGLARNIALEDSHRATIKKWNLSNIFVGPGSKKIFDKAGKLISNTLGDKAEKLLRKGALIGGYGMAPQLGLINKTDDIAKTPAQIEAENARLVEMRKSFEAYAKEQKKQVLEVIVESLNTVNQSVIDIELSDLKNPILKAAVSVEKAIDAFSLATDNSFGEIGDILQVSAESFKNKYLEALRNDFTKENVDKWNAAKIAFDAARKAQEDYTKAVISFTQQTAQTQGGFYQSHGIDTTFLAYQSIHTRLRAVVGALDNELGDLKLNGGNPAAWSDALRKMTANQMQEFLSSGNTELRKELVGIITEYKNVVMANGGKEGWIKPLADLEAVNKQIDALKLAKQTEETLKAQQDQIQREMNIQREQLSILNSQKAAVEKIGNIAQRIRNQVIDNTTSPINYANTLMAAKEAYTKGDFKSV
ncbi:tape measure protein [Campylobacter sp. RM16187]|uniref:tape measure protein n=1 Tax=Campylobacter sp. RM16187 TaxID=1660063 RepID=UPI0021B63DD1|nr:tape measure protein [Campylobacter sp. RM16187]